MIDKVRTKIATDANVTVELLADDLKVGNDTILIHLGLNIKKIASYFIR